MPFWASTYFVFIQLYRGFVSSATVKRKYVLCYIRLIYYGLFLSLKKLNEVFIFFSKYFKILDSRIFLK